MSTRFNLIIVAIAVFPIIMASTGDKSPYFHNCVYDCKVDDCEKDGSFQDSSRERLYNDLVSWNCNDECGYNCMFKTVRGYMDRKWNIPQFYGKWPFIRLLCFQEPASVFFSLLNMFAHYSSIKKFRSSVRPDSPLYWLWHVFAIVCMNGWLWSTIYHTRDTERTEILDYIFAYSMVFISFYSFLIRMLHRRSKTVKASLSAICFVFFMQHSVYLYYGKFDYNYNMMANVFTGLAGGIGWLIWCYIQRKRRPYAWKCSTFVLLAMSSLILELKDFAPIFWVFDAHSIWHLSSAPLTLLFYNFIIDDCISLRNENDAESKRLF